LRLRGDGMGGMFKCIACSVKNNGISSFCFLHHLFIWFLKDSWVTDILLFFSWWLLWAITWPFKLLHSLSLQAVYKHDHKDCTLTLQHFIIFFGAFELSLAAHWYPLFKMGQCSEYVQLDWLCCYYNRCEII